MRSPGTQLVDHRSSPILVLHSSQTKPKSVEHRLFNARVTKATVTTEFSSNPVLPRVYRNPLVPDRPYQEQLFVSPGFVPQSLIIKIKCGQQDAGPLRCGQIPLRKMFLQQAFSQFCRILHEGSAVTPLVVLGIEG
jgi:hypothetical protein